MNIKDIQKEKQILEKNISDLLTTFIKENELVLRDIEFGCDVERSATGISQTSIKVFLKIEL